MNNEEIQKLRDLPIEAVAERLGLTVTHHKSLCPFHTDRHPSLSFSVGRNTFHCFVCGARGGTIDLVMRYLNLNFYEACRWLADANNIILSQRQPASTTEKTDHFDPTRYQRFFEHPQLSDTARHFLYEERRLHPGVVSWCRLSSWCDRRGTEWLQIPYYDLEGKLIGIQNRRLTSGPDRGNDRKEPRFRFPSGSRCSIYNLPIVNHLKDGDELWIAEGCSDCWAMCSDHHRAIAIPSATLLMPQDKEYLAALVESRHLQVRMAPDNDAPGYMLYLKLKEVLPSLVHQALPPGCKDYSEMYLTSHPA